MENLIEVPEGEAIVVYDSRTGNVRHIHEEITLPGGQPSDPKQLTDRALHLATLISGQPLGDVKTLVTKSSQIRGGGALRVDVAKQALVKQEPRKVA